MVANALIPGAVIGALLLSLVARTWVVACSLGLIGFVAGAVVHYSLTARSLPPLAELFPTLVGAGLLVGPAAGAITQWGKRRSQRRR